MNREYRELSSISSSASNTVEQHTVTPRSKMRTISQLWLLFLKNAILLRRNILWTFFELILPVLFTLPIIAIVLENKSTSFTPEVSFGSARLRGSFDDSLENIGFTQKVFSTRCYQNGFGIAYASDESHEFADELMKTFQQKYEKMFITRMDSFSILQDTILADFQDGACSFKKYAAGIYFEKLQKNTKILKYKIMMPSSLMDNWKLDSHWEDRYGQTNNFYKIPPSPPYWESGFLTYQQRLDLTFIQLVTNQTNFDRDVLVQRLPEPSYTSDSLNVFFKYLPILWGLLAFLIVLHAAKDAAQEKADIKDFLSVMGLSTPMFYLSHTLFSFLKCSIVFLVCAVPLAKNMEGISTSLLLFTVLSYGYGVVSFGIFVSSMFKTSNSTIKVTVILWLISMGLAFKMPMKGQILRCFLFSLNINGAFSMTIDGMSEFLLRGEYIGWDNMFVGGHHWFTVGYGLVMIIVDIIWMSVMTLIFDKVLAGGDFSFMFYSNRPADTIDGNRSSNTDANEVDAGLLREGVEKISVENLVKTFYKTGETAVDHLSLKTYAGQVTVLLGHNGAGKSTTFSMICGLVQPSSGNITICGENANFHSCRRNLGLCPQGNPLFQKLTVMEHLWLIHGLKGASTDYKKEAKDLLNDIKLSEKADALSSNLSGGMKRKLCVCMALIGGSEVILLDEPTAGMDPGARRDVENILQKIKKDKSVLLTTHYMDEAEVLGDRVFIMNKGKVVCSGSPEFLTKKYGVGYVMTVVVEDVSKIDNTKRKILEAAQKCNIFNAKAEQVHGSQLEFTLPLDNQKNFPSFFEKLEDNQTKWGVGSFGLSLTTLEQVFLKVGEETESSSNDESVRQLYERLIESQRDERKRGFPLILNQLFAIITKRLLYSYRHWLQMIVQFLLPILILLGTRFLTTRKFDSSFTERDVTYDTIGPARIAISESGNPNMIQHYKNIVNNVSEFTLIGLPSKNLTAALLSLPKEIPPVALGAEISQDVDTVFFNAKHPHAIVSSLNLLHNALLNNVTNGQGSIGVSVQNYWRSSSTPSLGDGEDILLAPVLVLALSLITSSVVMFLVEERVSKFAHQQSLTGISPAAFWGFSFLYDTVLYTIICFIFTCMFIVYGWFEKYLIHVIIMWALYFWSCVPFVYTVSFIISSPSKANILLIIWQVLATLSALLIVYLLPLIPNNPFGADVTDFVKSLLLFLLPSFGLGNGFMTLGALSAKREDPAVAWQWEYLGRNYVFMLFFGLFASMIFLSFQFKHIRLYFFRLWEIRAGFNRVHEEREEEDEDVIRERNRLSFTGRQDDLAMEVQDLTKYYGKFLALDRLTLGVSNGECFGLLGVNGAGKTTTFDILTGISFPSSGTAKMDNRHVFEQIAIGYCPQFDAVLMDLTGRETLKILARLYGFSNPSRKAAVVLKAVDLDRHGDKLARFYSGGQRRKLSIGLALMASTRMVILDEPTAGIDPKARRDIWEVLSLVRNLKESAMVLTSHSMDECEALCNRIAVLRQGKMIAIGTNQHLKSKYGNNYTLTVVASSSDSKKDITKTMTETFPNSTLKTHAESASLTMKWQIPRGPNDKWSIIFKKCQELADSVNAKDFCLAQSTLEETFLRLTNNGA